MPFTRKLGGPTAVASCLLLGLPAALSGQIAERSRPSTSSVTFGPAVPSQGPVQSRRKSPAVAGLMSLVLPFGAGSFYAENGRHGQRHLAISGLSFFVAALGFGSSRMFEEVPVFDRDGTIVGSKFRGCDLPCGVGVVAALTFTANWIWSIGTAVGDANRFNQGRPRVSLLVPWRHGRIGLGAQVRF